MVTDGAPDGPLSELSKCLSALIDDNNAMEESSDKATGRNEMSISLLQLCEGDVDWITGPAQLLDGVDGLALGGVDAAELFRRALY